VNISGADLRSLLLELPGRSCYYSNATTEVRQLQLPAIKLCLSGISGQQISVDVKHEIKIIFCKSSSLLMMYLLDKNIA
jgi:hypothetical protein